jgi:hypothetical protein
MKTSGTTWTVAGSLDEARKPRICIAAACSFCFVLVLLADVALLAGAARVSCADCPVLSVAR